MATDYEHFYQDNPHGLGEPTKEFISFFDDYTGEACEVLDIGCGQGRDALFIAKRGHKVTAIDLSPTGIADLAKEAQVEKLSVVAIVADVRDYVCTGKYDVIVVDRTLHMLRSDERTSVLRHLLNASKKGSHILIADEPSNIPAFATVFENSPWQWKATLARGGLLFMKRQ